VKNFNCLTNLDRCWTADRLAGRRQRHNPRCSLYNQ
jgi:hypothetical protein